VEARMVLCGGVRDGSIPPDEIRGTLLASQSIILGFLSEAQRTGVTYIGKTITLEGQEAYTFEQDLPERKAIARYLFDPETLLCLQRTLILQSQEKAFSFTVFSDYRETNGLPYPFRTRVIDAKRKVTTWEEKLSSVRIGEQLDETLFTVKADDSLWLFPLKVVSLIAVIGFVVWALRGKTTRSRSGRVPE
jgi:hypothetical protein